MASPDQQRIAKLLARAGVASRREIERMIAEGRVALNGMPVDTPAMLLPSLDGVTVDGAPVAAAEPARLFLYHKPPGLLVTERDPGGRPTIYDRLPRGLPRVMPVGRLDLATEGLLLLTTDGGLKRQLELPATGVQRAYRARAYGAITQPQLEELIEGVEIEGIRYGSIDANIERRTGANVWIELILTEGKNREVRRVLEHLGLQVSRLIRTRYGPFVLGDLPPGEVGEVRAHDVASFAKSPTRLDLPQPARQRERAVAPVRAAPPSVAPPDQRQPRRPAPRTGDPGPSEREQRRPDRARPHAEAGQRPPRSPVGNSANGEREPRRPPSAQARSAAPLAGAGQRPPRASAGQRRSAAPEPVASGERESRRPGPAKPRAAEAKPAKPARAARAKAFRDATGAPPPAPRKPGTRPRPPGRPPRGRS